MRKFLLFGALALSTLSFGQNVPSYVPTNGLIGYWPFNGNANDESGNGNNGIVNGATLTADRFGNSNKAYSFNGTNNYIDCGPLSAIPNTVGNITQSAWILAPNNQSPYCKMAIMSKRQLINQGWPTIGGGANGDRGFPVNNQAYFFLNSANYGEGVTNAMSSTDLTNDGNWHLVTGTKSGSTYKLYFDGILQSTLTDSYSLTSNSNLIIGHEAIWGFECEKWFAGKLDDIGIWNRALTQQEITDLFTSVSPCINLTASITPQGNTTFCQGGFVNLNANTGINYTYEWYKNGSLISNASTSSYQATSSGSYTVKVIDGGCSETSTATVVTVNSIPSNTVSSSGNTTFCSGGSINLTAQGTGSYLWSNGETSQSINVTQTGDYSVTVTQNNCTATSIQTTVTVNPTPTATLTPQSATTFCEGGSVELIASGGTSYQWNTGNQNSIISVNQSDNYTVNVFNQYNCQATASQNVTVNSNPIVTFTLPSLIHNENGLYTLNGSPTGGAYSGDGVSGDILDPSNIGLGKVTIQYDYTDNNGCSDSKTANTIVYDTTGTVCTSYVSISVTDTLIMDISLAGLNAPDNVNTMKVYPNPSNDIVTINNGNYALMNGYSIKIININAQEVFNSVINSQTIQIPVSQLGATGNYFINVYDNNLLLVESKILVLQ